MQISMRRRAESTASVAAPGRRSHPSWAWFAAFGISTAAFAAPAAEAPLKLDAPSVFKRVQASTQQRSFVGTYVVSSGGAMSTSRIVHYSNGREQIDKIESLDGQMQRIYRHNELVHILWPQTHEASIEARDLMGRWPGPLSSPSSAASATAPASPATALDSPSTSYEAIAGRDDRVAGYEAQIVTLKPKDAWRYGQRWWLERETGLLLRNDLLGPKGEVLESAGFSELQIGAKLQPQSLLQEMNRLQGYRVQQAPYKKTSLDQEGWALKRPVPGFKPHACVRRAGPTTPSPANKEPRARLASGGHSSQEPVMVQAIYTDGLTHVSLFIEPYDASRHSSAVHPATIGATQVVTRREGDWWITAVGEVPSATLQAFSQGLEQLKS